MRHLSLFSGIGGFDLAAKWIGWENVAVVEKDPFCLQVLKKNFPNTKQYHDIKEFTGAEYTGKIDIVTGGFPCQPFSQAGKRKGTDDDRHLWPEMLRVISTIKPTWVVAENVRGLLSISGGVVFEQVCLDLEAIGYEVQPIVIPAVAVNAPHRRDRVWFIAHTSSSRTWSEGGEITNEGGQTSEGGRESLRPVHGQTGTSGTNTANSNVTDSGQQYGSERHVEGMEANTTERTTRTDDFERQNQDAFNTSSEGLQRAGRRESPHSEYSRFNPNTEWDKNWIEVATEFCRVDDGLPYELGGLKLSKARHRTEQLKAYGNAIVPQVAYQIFNSINQSHNTNPNE